MLTSAYGYALKSSESIITTRVKNIISVRGLATASTNTEQAGLGAHHLPLDTRRCLQCQDSVCNSLLLVYLIPI